jgi:ACR3 family arsenite efflux pump ArsB
VPLTSDRCIEPLEIATTALFGFQSETVLATAIGVLVEVPVMLSVMRIVLPPRRVVSKADAHKRRTSKGAWMTD